MRFLKTMAKALAVGLIAATGIGIVYLLSKTQVVNEGFRGISYDGGKLKVLEPGIHLLLSPLHVFDKEIPINKDEVVRLDEFEIKTSDSVPAMIQADFTFRIENAKDAILEVDN
jgi:regulator of protease activity HflC (stomatin/prohibitin superfamily)